MCFARRLYKKWQLKRSLAAEYRELVEYNFFGAVEECLGTDYNTCKKDIESRYLKDGLTQKEIEKVWKNLGTVPCG